MLHPYSHITRLILWEIRAIGPGSIHIQQIRYLLRRRYTCQRRMGGSHELAHRVKEAVGQKQHHKGRAE